MSNHRSGGAHEEAEGGLEGGVEAEEPHGGEEVDLLEAGLGPVARAKGGWWLLLVVVVRLNGASG